jgi:hypothetical protein
MYLQLFFDMPDVALQETGQRPKLIIGHNLAALGAVYIILVGQVDLRPYMSA